MYGRCAPTIASTRRRAPCGAPGSSSTRTSTTRISLQDLAGVTGLPPSRLLRAFGRAVGMSPHAYQRQVRLRHATTLIRAGTAISDAALAAGFADQAHFTRLFRGRWESRRGRTSGPTGAHGRPKRARPLIGPPVGRMLECGFGFGPAASMGRALMPALLAKVAELADAPVEGLAVAIPWGFESPLSHHHLTSFGSGAQGGPPASQASPLRGSPFERESTLLPITRFARFWRSRGASSFSGFAAPRLALRARVHSPPPSLASLGSGAQGGPPASRPSARSAPRPSSASPLSPHQSPVTLVLVAQGVLGLLGLCRSAARPSSGESSPLRATRTPPSLRSAGPRASTPRALPFRGSPFERRVLSHQQLTWISTHG